MGRGSTHNLAQRHIKKSLVGWKKQYTEQMGRKERKERMKSSRILASLTGRLKKERPSSPAASR